MSDWRQNNVMRRFMVRRHTTAKLRGKMLQLLVTRIVVVPYEPSEDGNGWDCVVLVGNQRFSPGTVNITVCNDELLRAIELPIPNPFAWRLNGVQVPE